MKSNQEITIPEAKVNVKAKLNQTEDQTKVENSIQNILNEKHIIRKTNDNYILIEGDLLILSKIRKRISEKGEEEVLSKILEKNRNNNISTFFVNKQSALNNNIHLIDESMSVLGDIKVEIISDNLDDIMLWFNHKP